MEEFAIASIAPPQKPWPKRNGVAIDRHSIFTFSDFRCCRYAKAFDSGMTSPWVGTPVPKCLFIQRLLLFRFHPTFFSLKNIVIRIGMATPTSPGFGATDYSLQTLPVISCAKRQSSPDKSTKHKLTKTNPQYPVESKNHRYPPSQLLADTFGCSARVAGDCQDNLSPCHHVVF